MVDLSQSVAPFLFFFFANARQFVVVDFYSFILFAKLLIQYSAVKRLPGQHPADGVDRMLSLLIDSLKKKKRKKKMEDAKVPISQRRSKVKEVTTNH